MKKCEKCGEEIKDGELVCPSCGQPVEEPISKEIKEKSDKESDDKRETSSQKTNNDTDNKSDIKLENELGKNKNEDEPEYSIDDKVLEEAKIKKEAIAKEKSNQITNEIKSLQNQRFESRNKLTSKFKRKQKQKPNIDKNSNPVPNSIPNDTYNIENQHENQISDNQNSVVSVGGFIVNMLVLFIPLVGLIVAVVWLLGGSKNTNRINMAKAYLILFIFLLVGFVIGGISLVSSGNSTNSVAYNIVDKCSNNFFSEHKIRNFNDFVDIYYKIEHFNDFEKYMAEAEKKEETKEESSKDDKNKIVDKFEDKAKDNVEEKVEDKEKVTDIKGEEKQIDAQKAPVKSVDGPNPPAPNINYYYYYYPAPVAQPAN